MDDCDHLAKDFIFWLKATVVALLCHGTAVLVAAVVVAATGANVAGRLHELTTFAREQLNIWNGR